MPSTLLIPDSLLPYLTSKIFIITTIIIFLCWLLFQSLFPRSPHHGTLHNIPTAGQRSRFEPPLLLRFRFLFNGRAIIRSCYQQSRDSIFRIARNDTDLLILPQRYLSELRGLPESVCSSSLALVTSMGVYTALDPLRHNDLHIRVVQKCLTPFIGGLIHEVSGELGKAWGKEVPLGGKGGEWEKVDMYRIIVRLIARLSAYVLLGGKDASEDEQWLKTSVDFTMNVFATTFLLRFFPRFTHRVVGLLLPSTWRIQMNLRAARKVVGRIVRERGGRRKYPQIDVTRESPDFLDRAIREMETTGHGMDELPQLQLILGLAAIHTTAMLGAQAVYEMCARPEYIDLLREEARVAVDEEGRWNKKTVDRLQMLDSFLKEAQRVNPPSFLSFNRILKQSVTFSDGVHLPPGSHFSLPSDAITADPLFVSSPDTFDGLRYFRRRHDHLSTNTNTSHDLNDTTNGSITSPLPGTQSHPASSKTDEDDNDNDIDSTVSTTPSFQPGKISKPPTHLLVSTTPDYLHFGHGKYACPGRFWAATELKMILGQLLLRYDLSYLGPRQQESSEARREKEKGVEVAESDAQTTCQGDRKKEGDIRPKNFAIDEFQFPDPRARLWIRAR